MVWNCILCTNKEEDVNAIEHWHDRGIGWICPNHNYDDIDKVIELTWEHADEVARKNIMSKLTKQFKIFCENIGLDS